MHGYCAQGENEATGSGVASASRSASKPHCVVVCIKPHNPPALKIVLNSPGPLQPALPESAAPRSLTDPFDSYW